ncbi:hypothetical protein [Mesorhizobium sp. LjNodule214]|uniref:hypothetical protein n=1 Tax=Mesorhizobium sp. LjNodule214 TaxID=3342252 RepID=UPI003ED05EDD
MTTTVDIAMTGKGQRYAAEKSNAFDTGALSTSVDMSTVVDTDEESTQVDLLTLQIDRTSRKALATSIEVLIDMLDAISPDPDLEDTADDEPYLGWTAHGSNAGTTDDREGDDSDFEDSGDEHDASATANWAKGGHWCEDVEEENEHGGDILDEPHDGRDDDKPWLGWANATGQTGIDVESVQEVKDSPDYGGAGNFTGEGCDQARDLLRSRRHRLRPEPSLTIVGPAFPLFAR